MIARGHSVRVSQLIHAFINPHNDAYITPPPPPHSPSSPGLSHLIADLYQSLDSRLSVFKRLLSLSGRLDLLLSQVALARAGALSADGGAADSAGVFVDNDDESDDDSDDSDA